MWVFPGGRVDPDDFTGDEPTTTSTSAGRTAAVREAHEEAGLVRRPPTRSCRSRTGRRRPRRRSASRPSSSSRPRPRAQVTIDDGEIRDHMWVSPAEALRAPRRARDRARAADLGDAPHAGRGTRPSTPRSTAAARAEPEHFTTKAVITDEGVVVLWHGDAGYEDGDAAARGPAPPALDGRHRLALRAHRPPPRKALTRSRCRRTHCRGSRRPAGSGGTSRRRRSRSGR